VARLALSKASLTAQGGRLKTYERYLPSLDLKRQQLIRERALAAERLATTGQAIADLRARVRAELPMASDLEVEVTDLVTVAGVELGEDNLMGVRLPRLDRVSLHRRRYALLDEAVRTITQRVNLFDKVLIPRTRANIKRIRIFLADGERAAVVRAKIAKAKRARDAQA